MKQLYDIIKPYNLRYFLIENIWNQFDDYTCSKLRNNLHGKIMSQQGTIINVPDQLEMDLQKLWEK